MPENLNKTIKEIWADNYIIPLYQRNFAWRYEQINQLLQDIYDSYISKETNYYVGSLVVMQRSDGTYEVIDGQQRLTVLSILCKMLNILDEPQLSYDSRPEIINFFNVFFKQNSDWEKYVAECKEEGLLKISKLLDAVDFVANSKILKDIKTEEYTTIKMLKGQDPKFKDYINEHVILVRTVLPSDADVAAYFEIMNNRGEQLQEHEIVKALMMKDLKPTEKNAFSLVWDACSQMNIPIQKSLWKFHKLLEAANYENHEKGLFILDEDSFCDIDILDQYKIEDGSPSKKTIDEIINETNGVEIKERENEIDEKFESIIDFPNFLMHVFKLKNEKVPLNADNLLSTYDEEDKQAKEYINNPMLFIKELLKCRVFFDKFVIKNQGDENEIENVKWILQRPYCDDNNLMFRNTFGNETQKADAEKESNEQKRIIKQQSMLQVTFSNKKYKNWLFDFLKFLKEKLDKREKIEGKAIVAYFDNWMSKYYKGLTPNEEQTNNMLNAGTATPHFLFNFIDYLYWVAKETNNNLNNLITHLDDVGDFDFKYYNSVEHHYPKSYSTNDNEVIKDYIGNLCLISGSTNSSLNNRSPLEKARIGNATSPKRKIMYEITKDEQDWDEDQIKTHGKEVEKLLLMHKEILGI